MTNPFGQFASQNKFNNAQGAEAPKPAGNPMDMFNNGVSASSDKFTDDAGQAVLVKAKQFVSQMATQFGPTDAIEVDWIVLDGPNAGSLRSGLIFSTVIVNALRTGLENGRPMTVGIIGRADNAKPGQSPAWLLKSANEAQMDLAIQAAKTFNWV